VLNGLKPAALEAVFSDPTWRVDDDDLRRGCAVVLVVVEEEEVVGSTVEVDTVDEDGVRRLDGEATTDAAG